MDHQQPLNQTSGPSDNYRTRKPLGVPRVALVGLTISTVIIIIVFIVTRPKEPVPYRHSHSMETVRKNHVEPVLDDTCRPKEPTFILDNQENQVLNGVKAVCDGDGKWEYFVTFYYGKKHGDEKKWHPNGQLKEKSKFDMGRLLGSEFWYPTGVTAKTISIDSKYSITRIITWDPKGNKTNYRRYVGEHLEEEKIYWTETSLVKTRVAYLKVGNEKAICKLKVKYSKDEQAQSYEIQCRKSGEKKNSPRKLVKKINSQWAAVGVKRQFPRPPKANENMFDYQKYYQEFVKGLE